MASLGHIVVGMAAARVQSRGVIRTRPALAAMLFWAGLSFLPDADVVGFSLGVRYGDPWGHRGATHSFAFALALGIVVGALAPRFGYRALFWPFDLTRYFAPWTPLPVSPIGLGYLSPYGLYVAAVELMVFSPLLIYALVKPRRPIG